MSELPAGWINTNLGSIASFVMGQAPSAQDCNFDGKGTVFVKAGEFGKTEPVVREWTTKPLKFVQKGDILVCVVGATAGKINLSIDCAIGRSVAAVRPELNSTPKYIYYFLTSQITKLRQGSTGSAQGVISKPDLANISLCLPPLAEQTRIAQKLDERLAQVDTLKARIDDIPALLKRFRQSVLAAAVSGRLTEEWRGSDCGEWHGGVLGDFVGIDVGYAFKSSEFSTTGVRLLRGQNIEPGALRWTETKFYPEAKLAGLEGLFIAEGDIILAMDRPIVSAGLKLARARKKDLPCVLVQRVSRFKGFRGVIPDYLMLLLSDLSFSNYLLPNQTGSDIPHISGKQILNYHVTLPTTIEQTEIVRRVEQLFAFAEQLEAKVATAQARIDRLTQSILAKAFRGELVPQDPNDEPASLLLERIQAQRAAAPKAKRGRKTTGV